MYTKHDNNIKQIDTPYIENAPVQKVMVEESTRHKWVNYSTRSGGK